MCSFIRSLAVYGVALAGGAHRHGTGWTEGLRGSARVGARIYVQDEASSVVWGMPGFVARGGLADKILPLDQIGAEIVRATALQVAARIQS